MGVRSAFTALLFFSTIAVAQISGLFYLDKKSYSAGEPIFVNFQVVNHNNRAETLYIGDRSSLHPLCSPVTFKISRVQPVEPVDPAVAASCHAKSPNGGAISVGCGYGTVVLQPGETHVERVLLNVSQKVDTPGHYTGEAGYGLYYSGGSESLPKIRSPLAFDIDGKAVEQKVFQPWVDQLNSPEPMKRLEAARTLATLAPRSLENLLLTFANDPWIREYAPLALHRLNTPRSIQALRELATHTEPGTWENRKASEYLANDQCSGDY